MATSKTQTPELPSVLAMVDGDIVLDGLDVRDKAELVDRPFSITAVKMTVSERDYALAWVEAEFDDGEQFNFTDSSKNGVRWQLEQTLAALTGGEVKLDEWVDIVELIGKPIKAPRGLRVSNHEQPDSRNRNKMVPVKSYYITTAGKRTRA